MDAKKYYNKYEQLFEIVIHFYRHRHIHVKILKTFAHLNPTPAYRKPIRNVWDI